MKNITRILVRSAVVLLCILVPPMVTNRGWWFVGRTYDGFSEPFEVFGMLVSLAILLYWYVTWRGREGARLERLIPALVVGVIVMQFLFMYVNHAGISWDYRCYDGAARNLTKGLNPYTDTAYLYPPLLAQALAGLNGAIESTRVFAYDNVTSWWLVFYFYQAVQLLLIFLIAELSFSFTRRLGIPLAWAAGLVLVVFVLNAPLFRTVRFQQTNLWVLLAIIYSLVHLRSRPIACGILMAIAVMVKPQGIVFPLVWLFIGARAAALAFVVAAGVLILAQGGFGSDWTTWGQFIDSVAKIPKTNDFFRNQSLYSVISTLARTLGLDVDRSSLLLVVRIIYVGVLGWFVYRFMDREKRFKSGLSAIAKDARSRYDLIARIGAHTTDVVLLALLCSPIVWEHHYAIALPVIVWIVALTRGHVPRLALIGLILMFVPSTFDVWLFSYHRLVGAVMLMIALSPARVFATCPEWKRSV